MPIPQLKEAGFQSRKISQQDSGFSPRRTKPFSLKKKARRWIPKLIGVVLVLGIYFVGMVAWYSRDLPDPNKIMDRSVALSTKIYDRTGETLLYEIHGPEQRTLITIDQIPKNVVNATIAIEDKTFYEHQGISLWGILRGQIMPRLQGKRAQGGSTLTQQFVKNAILTDERKFSRKIKEWILSFRIEQKYTKDQILQMYFNEIPYGGSAYGVQSASQYYFGKDVKDITLAEAAVLAALPQAPTYYRNNMEALIARQHTILKYMVEQGYISQEEADEAKQQEIVLKERTENIKAPHFVLYVKQLLEEKYGTNVVETSGWKITTSLDYKAQEAAEKAIEEQAEKNLENYEAQNAALVALDVNTSEILAMVGSKDYFNDDIDGQYNVATASRQPGSSIKPMVYLTAFNRGYRPDTIIFDLVTNFAAAGTPYIPHNYDLQERGPVTMRSALAGSLNIPAVKTLYLAGVYNVLDMISSFGYTTLTDRDRYGLSLVLGGGEVKLLEHVNAFATLAREGVYQDTVPILKIEDSSGKVIEENKDIKGRRVIEKEPVRLVNDILSDNAARAYIFGESNYLTLGDRPVAAKTGTTNDYKDAWTVGYTPQIAAGVWVGNNDFTEMKRGADGSVVAAPIWNKFMREVTKDLPVMSFAKTELEPCSKPMVCGELSGSEPVKIDTMSGKLATEYTPYTTIEEKKFMDVHSILYYVNTNDPLGAPLENPNSDPQFNLWEGPVLAWAEKEGYTSDQSAPTEYDDVHLPEYRPKINWLTPDNNQTITQAQFNLEVETSAPRGVERVEYFLDNQKIGTSYSEPFSYSYQLNPFVSNGSHELKAMAFDDLDNFKEDIININIQVEENQRDFNLVWINPSSGDNISSSDLPITLELNLDKPNKVKKIDFYYLDPDNKSQWFGYIENPTINNLSIQWGQDLITGVYKLYLVVKDSEDNLMTTPPIIVNIN